MDLVFSRTKKIPNKNWGQECSLCSSRHGVPIECSARGCKAAYHTTCAIRGKLKMQAIFGKNFKGGIKLRSYCKDHSPTVTIKDGTLSPDDKIDASGVKEIDMTNLVDDRLQTGGEELDYFWKYVDINEVHKNISEAYARKRRLQIARSSDDASDPDSSLKKTKKSKDTPTKKAMKKIKAETEEPATPKDPSQDVDPLVLDLIYRYWMLLRTSNNGQSLIKFSPSALKEREFEQRKSIMKLRIELERVRNLSYMIGKREKLKSSWLKTHQNIIKRTFSVINEISPSQDAMTDGTGADSNHAGSNHVSSHHHVPNVAINGKKSLQVTQHLQPSNGMFDESDQLLNDLITCDHIYEVPQSSTNSNYINLSHQERSTLERRRTLSLVRRINRQLKSVSCDPPMNPYAKSYVAPKRNDSPVGLQQGSAVKMLKFR